MERDIDNIIRTKVHYAEQQPVAWSKDDVWRSLASARPTRNNRRAWYYAAAAVVVLMASVATLLMHERSATERVQSETAAADVTVPNQPATKNKKEPEPGKPSTTKEPRNTNHNTPIAKTSDAVAVVDHIATDAMVNISDAPLLASTDTTTSDNNPQPTTIATQKKVRAVVGVWLNDSTHEEPLPIKRPRHLRLAKRTLTEPDDGFAVESKKVMARLH